MDYSKLVVHIVPSIIEIIKDALTFDHKTATGILLGVLGTSDENRTRVAMLLEEAKNQEFYKKVKEELESAEKKLDSGVQPPT